MQADGSAATAGAVLACATNERERLTDPTDAHAHPTFIHIQQPLFLCVALAPRSPSA